MKTLTTFIVVICVSLGASCALSACGPEGAVRLGPDSAGASRAAGERQAPGVARKSPMPAGRYGSNNDELRLVNPRRNELDEAVEELTRRYARSDEAERARTRDSISTEELTVLEVFAGRAAVFGMRERRAEWLAAGVTAVAMLEMKRIDFRDLNGHLCRLYHAAARVGADQSKLFGDAARLAEPEIAEFIRKYSEPGRVENTCSACGVYEVETEGGVGFIMCWYEPYNPTYELKHVAIDVARLVGREYDTTPSVASEFPANWLEGVDDDALRRAEGRVRAAASVHTLGRRGQDADAAFVSGTFMVFIVELADEESAQALLGIARRKKVPDYVLAGLAERRLFCLVIASTSTTGGERFETGESLSRFTPGLAEILRRYAKH